MKLEPLRDEILTTSEEEWIFNVLAPLEALRLAYLRLLEDPDTRMAYRWGKAADAAAAACIRAMTSSRQKPKALRMIERAKVAAADLVWFEPVGNWDRLAELEEAWIGSAFYHLDLLVVGYTAFMDNPLAASMLARLWVGVHERARAAAVSLMDEAWAAGLEAKARDVVIHVLEEIRGRIA